MAAATRRRVRGATTSDPRTTLDTVDRETPASAATSPSVGNLLVGSAERCSSGMAASRSRSVTTLQIAWYCEARSGLPLPRARRAAKGWRVSIPVSGASTRRLRVGVVGGGLIAQVMHLHYLRELSDRFDTTVVCDAAEANALACAERFGIPKACTDWRELLDEPLDAVLVLTSGSHAPIAIEAASRGLHVMVEKPMCFSTVEGKAMIDAATTTDVTLMVAYNKRYDPAYLRFRDEAAAVENPRLMRITTLESPSQPYGGHYPISVIAQPPAAVAMRMRLGAAAAVR